MKRTYNLLMIVGLIFGLNTVSLSADTNTNNSTIEHEILADADLVTSSEQDEADMAEFLATLDAIPQEGLSLQQKATLAWAMLKMQADKATEFVAEHPYTCLAGAVGTTAVITGIIYAIKHARKQ